MQDIRPRPAGRGGRAGGPVPAVLPLNRERRAPVTDPARIRARAWQNPAMRIHEWRDETDDGEQRTVRATLHGKQWRFEARLKSEPDYTEVPRPPLEWLHDLRDVLWNKYQRRRVPHEQVARLDVLIEEAEARGDR